MKNNNITNKEIENIVALEIGDKNDNQINPALSDNNETGLNEPKSLKERLLYFKGKVQDEHGIKINLQSKSGNRSVWMNPFNLLKEDNPLESDEMNRVMQSLGISNNKPIKVKSIECKALGFEQKYSPPLKLDAEHMEKVAMISGILVELEEKGHTELFKQRLADNNSRTMDNIISEYEKFENEPVVEESHEEQECEDLEREQIISLEWQ